MADVDPRDLTVLRDVEAHVRLWERYGVSEITIPTEQARHLVDVLTRVLSAPGVMDARRHESTGENEAYVH